ncbi:MAG: hypothetical protein OEZ48_00645 [Candidatus Bathyarchaeota archaeon]|nr:hypothetical protein [Candidatus Bathyarchaeota archaeon]MDH5686365.1 hypothetical protein [Candidatus Bathyarchaeota archaeon]
MPFTPYHWGPSSWIGLILFRFLDLPTLLVASVIVDAEPFSVLLLGLNYPLHGFLHSFLGGSMIAVLTSIIMYQLKDVLQNLTAVLKLAQDSSFRKILWTSFFGVYLHILLDSPLYSDIRPFYPIESNPFYGLISSQQIYLFCSISFLVGTSLYLFRLFVLKTRK